MWTEKGDHRGDESDSDEEEVPSYPRYNVADRSATLVIPPINIVMDDEETPATQQQRVTQSTDSVYSGNLEQCLPVPQKDEPQHHGRGSTEPKNDEPREKDVDLDFLIKQKARESVGAQHVCGNQKNSSLQKNDDYYDALIKKKARENVGAQQVYGFMGDEKSKKKKKEEEMLSSKKSSDQPGRDKPKGGEEDFEEEDSEDGDFGKGGDWKSKFLPWIDRGATAGGGRRRGRGHRHTITTGPGAYHMSGTSGFRYPVRRARRSRAPRGARGRLAAMITANVEQVEDPEMLEPSSSHPNEQMSMEKKEEFDSWYRRTCVKFTICLLALAAVAIGIAVPLSKSGSGDDPYGGSVKDADTVLSPTGRSYNDTRAIILDLSSEESLLDDSHQKIALDWIVFTDEFAIQESHIAGLRRSRILQRYALTVLYFAIGREDWLDPRNDECSWVGVGCGANKEIIPHIQYLSLREEKFREKDFEGVIPPELGFLISLETIHLSHSNIVDFYMEVFSELSNLKELILRSNSIRGTIPSEIGLLTNLEKIDFTDNKITGIIPVELYRLPKLGELLLGFNYIAGPISPLISQLTALIEFRADDNELTGTIPDEIRSLPFLTHLVLSRNNLRGNITEDLPLMGTLQTLQLMQNDFTGQIPSEIGTLDSLRAIWLSYNDLSSTMPSEIGNLSNLIDLRMEWGFLMGSIPKELVRLSNLERLIIANNGLESTIPTELGNLTNLVDLSLHTNELTGNIPTELGKLTNAVSLDLGANPLSGNLPSEICSLVSRGSLNQLSVPCTVECQCCGFDLCSG